MTADSHVSIICAEDDDDHFFLLKSILEDLSDRISVYRANDGEELLDLLLKRGKFTNKQYSFPIIILLDLNMPKKNGFDALKEIRSLDQFKTVPIIVLTASDNHQDIHKCYELGANAFITKPGDFNEFNEMMKCFCDFWLNSAQLPRE